MHQTVVTFEELADLRPGMDLVAVADAGMILTLTGRHPALGSFVSVQDINDGIVLLSQHPYRARPFPGPGESADWPSEIAG